jgi:large conductance mechanosensitive channel
MGLLKEFREFAVRGNVMDMAVGIIIGAAFGKIVSSLVADVIMPPIGVLLGGVDFSAFSLTLRSAAPATADTPAVAAVTLNYGKFINTVIDFVIVAFAIFAMIKVMNAARRKQAAQPPPAPPAPTPDQALLTEIRDLIRAKGV